MRYPFCEITTPSVQQYPKCLAAMSLFLSPGEGERVSFRTQYYNLNDLLPPTVAFLFDAETPSTVGGEMGKQPCGTSVPMLKTGKPSS